MSIDTLEYIIRSIAIQTGTSFISPGNGLDADDKTDTARARVSIKPIIVDRERSKLTYYSE